MVSTKEFWVGFLAGWAIVWGMWIASMYVNDDMGF